MEKRVTEKGWPRVAEPCGGTPRWHGHVSDDVEVVVVWLRHIG